jgi:GMP-PDE, delta subunit
MIERHYFKVRSSVLRQLPSLHRVCGNHLSGCWQLEPGQNFGVLTVQVCKSLNPPGLRASAVVLHHIEKAGARSCKGLGIHHMPCFTASVQGELVREYDMSLGFCIPNSVNTWEAEYDMPLYDEQQVQDFVRPIDQVWMVMSCGDHVHGLVHRMAGTSLML